MKIICLLVRNLLPMLIVAACVAPATAQPLKAAPPEYSAEFLRLSNHRLYLWIEGEHFVNSQFVITISRDGEQLEQVAVADNAGAVVVSKPLPDYLANLLSLNANRCQFMVSFPTARLADTLFVGLPRDLQLQLFSFFAGGLRSYLNSGEGDLQLPVWYEPVLYDDDRDAEIDLKIGAVDLLLWPELDAAALADDETKLYRSGDFVEFAVITGFTQQELTAAALNYCLRGIFDQGDSTSPRSYLMLDRDLESEFPRSPKNAALLYSQMREQNRTCKLTVLRSGLYSRSLEIVQADVNSCGGLLQVEEYSDSVANAESSGVEAFMTPILQPGNIPTEVERENALRWILSLGQQLPLAEKITLPAGDCALDTEVSADCISGLSSFFARSARVIPLGRQRLVFIAGAGTSVVAPQSESYKIHDFYRLKNSGKANR